MNADPGYCYIILFSNGFIKGGKSRDILTRYKTHKAAAIGLGISVKRTFYTEPHSAYHTNEKRLLATLSLLSEERVGEFFRGVTEASAVEALISLGLEIRLIEECPLGMFQDAFIEMSIDRELTGEVGRVLYYFFGKLDFENYIHLAQTEIADALGMQKTHVSRAVKILCDKGIILKGPKVGRSITYRLNSDYGWKGKVKNYEAEQRQRFKLIQGGKDAPSAK